MINLVSSIEQTSMMVPTNAQGIGLLVQLKMYEEFSLYMGMAGLAAILVM